MEITLIILISLLIIINILTIILFIKGTKSEITKQEIIIAINDVKEVEQTKMEAFVIQSIFVGGIHALLLNKGLQVSYREIEESYIELQSTSEVLYKMLDKYKK